MKFEHFHYNNIKQEQYVCMRNAMTVNDKVQLCILYVRRIPKQATRAISICAYAFGSNIIFLVFLHVEMLELEQLTQSAQ